MEATRPEGGILKRREPPKSSPGQETQEDLETWTAKSPDLRDISP